MLDGLGKSPLHHIHPVPFRGAYHDRHVRGAGRGGRWQCRQRTARERTAKSCGPDARYAGVKFRGNKLLRSDGGKRASAHRGERAISRKAIAQGMSDCLRCPVCSCAQLSTICTRDRGCSVHPAFPAPSDYRRSRKILANLGRIALRERESISAVISIAAKQSMLPHKKQEWIASRTCHRAAIRPTRWLAMTWRELYDQKARLTPADNPGSPAGRIF